MGPILSEMSHPKSYTEIVGGSIYRRRLSRAWDVCRTCGRPILQDRLEATTPHFFLGMSIYRKRQ